MLNESRGKIFFQTPKASSTSKMPNIFISSTSAYGTQQCKYKHCYPVYKSMHSPNTLHNLNYINLGDLHLVYPTTKHKNYC